MSSIASSPLSLRPSVGELESLYEEHADFVWRSLQRFGVWPSDLEDALQEVFLVVHKRLKDYDPTRAKITTWLFGIARTVALAFRRRHRRMPMTPLDLEGQLLTGPIDPSSKEVVEAVSQALSLLTPELRATFLLFEIEQLPCAEIAELSGVPLGTVYSRLHLARKQLGRLLKKRGITCLEDES